MGNPWKNTEGLQLRHDGKFFGSSAAPTVMLVKSDDSNNLRWFFLKSKIQSFGVFEPGIEVKYHNIS